MTYICLILLSLLLGIEIISLTFTAVKKTIKKTYKFIVS